jgi:hypothetical protein
MVSGAFFDLLGLVIVLTMIGYIAGVHAYRHAQ